MINKVIIIDFTLDQMFCERARADEYPACALLKF